ncbi:MAG TPA: hypothetical protein VFU89_03510 [Rhabdochlamydiaceae bacterium]|nr:hypothetical protein [Rhabdochlamydiaceae bacterium]
MINVSASKLSNPPSTGWPKEQVTEESVNRLFVEKFKNIVASYEQRKNNPTNVVLQTGPWMANDYASALSDRKQQEWLKWLIDKNAIYWGFPPKGFTQKPYPGTPTSGPESGMFQYQIADGVLPTQALENVKSGQYSFIDCGMAVQLARLETLRDVFGDNRFNARFASNGSFPLRMNPQNSLLESFGLIKEIQYSFNTISPQFGEQMACFNIPLYRMKHHNGEAVAFNVVCISPSSAEEKEFIGFGLSSVGIKVKKIYGKLVEEFNQNPIDPNLICSAKIQEYLVNENKDFVSKIESQINCKLSDFKISLDVFESAVTKYRPGEQGFDGPIGLYNSGKRFDIEAIQKHM